MGWKLTHSSLASLPLDNTRAERALRKIVVGRKNWPPYGYDAASSQIACARGGRNPFSTGR
jgi:Transposase IS66 family